MNETDYTVLRWGIFDSSIKFPSLSTTRGRKLSCFEIELFTADCDGVAYIDGTMYAMKKGMLICGKPGQVRRSRLPFRCCYLHLYTDSAPLQALLCELPDATVVTDHDALAALFYKIAACGAESLPDALFLRSCTDRILGTLLRLAEKPKNPVADVSAHAAMLGDIREYIQGHYGEPLPLSALSQRAALSPVYFHRLFTACYGITPAQYTLTVRLNAAKQHLLAGDDTVADIAQACGFSSQSYFNYKFKEQVGMSPLQYRKKMLSKIDL